MKVANGVEMLKISASVMGRTSIINPTLIWDSSTVILVDAGYPGQMFKIREEIEKLGIPFEKLSTVILTHHDIDHIGSLSSIQKELHNTVTVLAHDEEKAYVQSDKYPVKVAHLEANLKSMPEKMKPLYEQLKTSFQNCKTNVHRTLVDEEELPYCGGIKIIHTPGHTPGHICLYLKQSKTLISGDALLLENGSLARPSPFTNLDTGLSIQSLKKLINYDIESVICYHGGLFTGNANYNISKLANE